MSKYNQNYMDIYSDDEKNDNSSNLKKLVVGGVVASLIACGAFAYSLYDDYKNHLSPKEEITQYVEGYDFEEHESEALEVMIDVIDSSKRGGSSYDNVSYNLALSDMRSSFNGNESELVKFLNQNMNKIGADFYGKRNYSSSEDELDNFYNIVSDNSGYDRLVDFIVENHSYLE